MSERLAYRTDEFAEMIGASRVQVVRWLNAGELAGTKVGGTWFVWASEAGRFGAYDARGERSQRGEPVPAVEGQPVGRERDDAGRTPPVAMARALAR